MRAAKYPTQERLRELFDYLPDVGQFLWREDRGPQAPKGGVAGFPTSDGTWRLWVNDQIISAQTAVWIYVHGKPPAGPIKHINGDRMDNRLENLCLLKGSTRHDLDSIKAKCEIVGDCWHWQGGRSGKTPALRHGDKTVNARRYIFTELLERKLAPGRMVTMSCGNLDCVAPDHLKQATRQQLQRATAERTKYGADRVRSAKISKAKRARSPYPDELVEQVRAMEGSAKGIARELGLCASTVNEWRKQRSPINNPWAGLLAA
jgi:hypothetical protein